ncbi:MAG: NUDIX domain-containing protein [Alphaproteobacteria bacterium]|nr:NUDIX domain-containing protein [Alphaproteobacteria bacterium]MDE2493201.1 NUDIX domain-containing protein [Alphaproteobacteria bacterium]
MKSGLEAGFLLSLTMTAKALYRPVELGAVALLEKDAKILLVRHSYFPAWSFPAGGVSRHEPPEEAVVREMQEEVGLKRASTPVLFGLYRRPCGYASNLNIVYHMRVEELAFKPNLEVREILFVDPADPPPNTSCGTLRRLAEFLGAPKSAYW